MSRLRALAHRCKMTPQNSIIIYFKSNLPSTVFVGPIMGLTTSAPWLDDQGRCISVGLQIILGNHVSQNIMAKSVTFFEVAMSD